MSKSHTIHQNELHLYSTFATMRDGNRNAISYWLPNSNETQEPRPVVLATTRYWRALALHEDKPEYQPSFPLASYLHNHGYILVVCDARGTGASFGEREMELPPEEVKDLGETIQWISEQAWCNGKIATTGISYTANTALMCCATNTQSLKLAVARAMDFDVYRQLVAPGGILNTWMAGTWGDMTRALDQNDTATVFADQPKETREMILGVRPVDDDKEGGMLKEAVSQHENNFNATEIRDFLVFIDDTRHNHPNIGLESFAIYHHQEAIQTSATPIIYNAGWYDAGTAAGALSFFASFSNPKRVRIGPYNHGGDSRADPFQPGDGLHPQTIPIEQSFNQVVTSLDAFLKPEAAPIEMGILEYYTLGENKWKKTRTWPLPETQMKRMFLSSGNKLSSELPTNSTGHDVYRVDPSAGTGQNNRWHTQVGGKAVHHPNRNDADKKLLVYDSAPLKSAIEITGHPVIHLNVRSTATDGQFFAYLEAILPDGRVKLVTEGQLRAIHRKVSTDPPPYKMFGPYHSYKKADAMPLIPDEMAQITFDLFPISVRFEANWRIRIAIAGADKDVFEPILGCETPELTLERNSQFTSYIDLPIIPHPN